MIAAINFKASVVFHRIWEALNKRKINEYGQPEHVYNLIIEEGSSRSTKTWSNFQALFLYLYENPLTSATILRDTQKSCRDIVEKDWKKWLKDPLVRTRQFEKGEITAQQLDEFLKKENLTQYFTENKTNHTWTFKHNDNQIVFTGLDDENNAMGMSQTICWINEPYNFSKEVFKQLAMRSKVILFDWNPKQNHWIEKEKVKDTTFVDHSTFKDNPFITAESRYKILGYQSVKYSGVVVSGYISEADAKVYDFIKNKRLFTQKQLKELARCIKNEIEGSASDYDWLVYGLGLKAENPKKIYKNWKAITLKEYNEVQEREYFGVDYGWAKPTAVVGIKYDGDRTFYVRPALYKPMNDMGEVPLGEFLKAIGFPSGPVTYGWADSSDKEAGSELSLTNDLRENYGFNLVPTNKPTYKSRWEFFTKVRICYVEDSEFEHEYENYSLEYINDVPTGKPIKKDDHYMNAFEYGGWGVKEYLGLTL
ncbi:MAG: phage terminase large subunit [Chryseobacterium sp.]|nr:phage terminase large subunit [Chryseobacterium sp.]MDN5423191.1 phage terminase large subunit [Chryseobacterium sp.]MDN5477071.1 phage terminase large subunit [Chryseobacterium sp.]